MGIPTLIYILLLFAFGKKLSHILSMLTMLKELRVKGDTINSLFSLFAIFFLLKELKHRKYKSKERLGFCKSIYWKNVGQVASLLNMLNVSQNYFLKDLGHEFCPSVPALIKGYQLWIKMADWTNDFPLLPPQIPSKWQKKYKNKSISVPGSPLGGPRRMIS